MKAKSGVGQGIETQARPPWVDARRTAARGALGVAALLSVSCSLVIDADRPQCRVDADCAGRSATFAGTVCRQRVCVTEGAAADAATTGSTLECDPVQSDRQTVQYSFATLLPTAGGLLSESPFSIRACEQLDLDCESPLLGPVEARAGQLTAFEVPNGFSGFFQIAHPGALPALYFMSRPVVADTVAWSPTVLTNDVLAQLAAAAGAPLDEGSGLVIASVRGCDGAPLAGATVTSSEAQALRYYVVNSLPVLAATETGPQGAVGFVNLPPRTLVLNGQTASGTPLSSVSLRVKSGAISLAELRPLH